MLDGANPQIWADNGGLSGLVVLALFVALGLFIRSISNIYNMHREDMRLLLELHQKERDDWWKVVDTRQRETNAAIQSMASALHKMATRRRITDADDI